MLMNPHIANEHYAKSFPESKSNFDNSECPVFSL